MNNRSELRVAIIKFVKRKDWRIWLGITLTIVWLVSWIVVAWNTGWDMFWQQDLNRLGGLEGLFAPLAFLWLVLGLFIQQKELAQNTRTLEQSNKTAEEQTRVLAATELRARQTAFFQIAEHVSRATGTLLGYMITTTLGPRGSGFFEEKELEDDWSRHAGGSYDHFPLVLLGDNLVTEDFLFGSRTNSDWTEDVIRNVRNLLKLAGECDDERGTITKSITQSSLGYVYMQILGLLKAPAAWAMFDTGIFGPVPTETVDVSGKWITKDDPGFATQPYRMELTQQSDGGVTGTLSGDVGVLEFSYGAIQGKNIFLRIMSSAVAFVITATLEEGTMYGSVHWREGFLWNFTAVPETIQEQKLLT